MARKRVRVRIPNRRPPIHIISHYNAAFRTQKEETTKNKREKDCSIVSVIIITFILIDGCTTNQIIGQENPKPDKRAFQTSRWAAFKKRANQWSEHDSTDIGLKDQRLPLGGGVHAIRAEAVGASGWSAHQTQAQVLPSRQSNLRVRKGKTEIHAYVPFRLIKIEYELNCKLKYK